MADPGAYPDLADLAAIGDGHSLALLGPEARVEWFCPTRFDTDPAVWPLLDRGRGGHLHIAPVDCVCTEVSYLPGTGVLRYEWAGSLGSARMTVAMRWPQEGEVQEILWLVEGLEGQVPVEVQAQFRTDWGRRPSHLTLGQESASWTNDERAFQLAGPVALEQYDDRAMGNATLTAGQRWGFRLRVAPHALTPSLPITADDVAGDLDATARHWRRWVDGIDYDGRWHDEVVRSAITLKMLIYEPSGAVVAAATTSLPEDVGGVRNWDYRYTWLRDAGLTLNALYLLGCTDEARAYARWLCETTAAHDLPLRVMYGIDGRTDLPEQEIDDLDGYRGSRPVRVGNGAEHQFQLDSYGELLDCLMICEILGENTMREEWPHFRRLVDFVAENWREPDSGIWEVRDRPRHFVHSKAMAWVALDRGCRLVQAHALEGDHDWWRREADALRTEVLERGVVQGRFRRAYDDDTVDASLLMLPSVGFVEGSDPLVAATIDAVRAQLTPLGAVDDALLWRYLATAGDGLPGHEGAFGIASFWLVEALAMSGKDKEAEATCEALLKMSGRAGLFAEEFDPATGDHLGNTPQAFTHIGLLNAVLRIHARSARAGGPGPGRSGRPAASSSSWADTWQPAGKREPPSD